MKYAKPEVFWPVVIAVGFLLVYTLVKMIELELWWVLTSLASLVMAASTFIMWPYQSFADVPVSGNWKVVYSLTVVSVVLGVVSIYLLLWRKP